MYGYSRTKKTPFLLLLVLLINTLGVVYSTGPYKTKEKELFFVPFARKTIVILSQNIGQWSILTIRSICYGRTY